MKASIYEIFLLIDATRKIEREENSQFFIFGGNTRGRSSSTFVHKFAKTNFRVNLLTVTTLNQQQLAELEVDEKYFLAGC